MSTVEAKAFSRTDEVSLPTADEYLAYVQAKQAKEQQAPVAQPANDVVVADERMQRIHDVVKQIAPTNVPALITGESGTGKEIVAKAIHNASDRASQPFVAINCAAIPASLLESELFGHEKGSFTGAHQRHLGKFEQAHGGTLLLDEVTEIAPAIQAKLLRVLQEREVERVGGQGPVSVDVRIIATTNRDIRAAVADGSFRQDLYYRLYVIHLEVPPLRERQKDIEALAQHFLGQCNKSFNKNHTLSKEAMNKLISYPWPGNVRELQNVIQRSVLMAKQSVITSSDFTLAPESMPSSLEWVRTLPVGRPMQDVETHFMLETLKYHRGNRTHAAKTLGISLRTLRNKINEFTARGIEVPQPTTGKALE